MDRYVFVDTWAWIALSNRKDTHHEVAQREYEEIKAAGYRRKPPLLEKLDSQCSFCFLF